MFSAVMIRAAGGGGTKVDLSSKWDVFIKALGKTANVDNFFNLAAVVGMLIVALAFCQWAWERRKSGGMGGGGNKITGALIAGLILSAPKVAIPAALLLFDVVINAFINIWNSTAGA